MTITGTEVHCFSHTFFLLEGWRKNLFILPVSGLIWVTKNSEQRWRNNIIVRKKKKGPAKKMLGSKTKI